MATPVRILTLLILAAGLASGHVAVLGVGGALLLATGVWIWRYRQAFGAATLWAMVRRVRWLLLAILVLYGWFTPGAALLPALGSLSPSLAGVQQGLLRVTALVAIVAAVYLLLATTARGELIAGLLWFGRPLRRLGVDDQRFAVRLVLALEAVPQVQALARAAMTDAPRAATRMQRLGDISTAVFRAVLARADQAGGVIDVPDPQPVPLWQWSLPLLLSALLLAVAMP